MTLTQSSKPTILGQSLAQSLLSRAIEQQHIHTGYLFRGPAGIGKRTCAIAFGLKILKAQKQHPDLIQVEPTVLHEGKLLTRSEATAKKLSKAAQIRIEQIRQLKADLQQSPLYASRRVAIIDEAETMNEAAANALLKILEEPGSAVVILVSNGDVLSTIQSRCQVVPFTPLTLDECEQVLGSVYPACLKIEHLLEFAQGSPGKAINAYQQLQQIKQAGIPLSFRTTTVLECLQGAKHLQKLDRSAVLWLIDWWQVTLWSQHHNEVVLQTLETAKLQIQQFCQSHLVWDVCLMRLIGVQSYWEIPDVPIEPTPTEETKSLVFETVEPTLKTKSKRAKIPPLEATPALQPIEKSTRRKKKVVN